MNIYICSFESQELRSFLDRYYLIDEIDSLLSSDNIFIGTACALAELSSLLDDHSKKYDNIYMLSPKFDNGTNRIIYSTPTGTAGKKWMTKVPVLNEDTVGDLFSRLMTSPPKNLFIDDFFNQFIWRSPFGMKFMDGIFKLVEKRQD